MAEGIDEAAYAGFWIRFFAVIIDAIILLLITAPITAYFYGFDYYTSAETPLIAGFGDVIINWVFPMIFTVAFWVFIGATPGKLALGLRVVDAQSGEKIGVIKGLLRYIGYYVSAVVLLIGYVWAAFDPRKQGWHDKIAGTLVIYAR